MLEIFPHYSIHQPGLIIDQNVYKYRSDVYAEVSIVGGNVTIGGGLGGSWSEIQSCHFGMETQLPMFAWL
jgi:hypothetical protein